MCQPLEQLQIFQHNHCKQADIIVPYVDVDMRLVYFVANVDICVLESVHPLKSKENLLIVLNDRIYYASSSSLSISGHY